MKQYIYIYIYIHSSTRSRYTVELFDAYAGRYNFKRLSSHVKKSFMYIFLCAYSVPIYLCIYIIVYMYIFVNIYIYTHMHALKHVIIYSFKISLHLYAIRVGWKLCIYIYIYTDT